MIGNLFFFLGTVIYMELVYHFACFGFTGFNPILGFPIWLLWAAFSSFITGFLRKKTNRIIFWVLLAVNYLLFASQLVYMKIFKQPLLIAAVKNTGMDAMTNYWREALNGILRASVFLLLLFRSSR